MAWLVEHLSVAEVLDAEIVLKYRRKHWNLLDGRRVRALTACTFLEWPNDEENQNLKIPSHPRDADGLAHIQLDEYKDIHLVMTCVEETAGMDRSVSFVMLSKKNHWNM